MLIDINYYDALTIKRALQGYNFVLNSRMNLIINSIPNFEKNSDYINISAAIQDNERVLKKFNKFK